MNPFMLESAAKPVNPLLGTLDESFESNASIKLLWCDWAAADRGNFTVLYCTKPIYSQMASKQLSCWHFYYLDEVDA